MAYDIGKLFTDYERLTKVKTKKDYSVYTEAFKKNGMDVLNELLDDIDGASEKEEIAKIFATDVFNTFEKRGKVKGTKLVTLNYFMIYYVFPTLLAVRPEDGTAICDAIKDAWNSTFDNCNIGYTDYDSINEGFITRLFGIPIGNIGSK